MLLLRGTFVLFDDSTHYMNVHVLADSVSMDRSHLLLAAGFGGLRREGKPVEGQQNNGSDKMFNILRTLPNNISISIKMCSRLVDRPE